MATGNGNEPAEHEMRHSDELTRTVARVVDEVHANTHSLGQVTAELSRLRAAVEEARAYGLRSLEEVQKIGARLGRMRDRMASIPGEAEDTARHQIEELRAELTRRENEELRQREEQRRASDRVARDRKWQLLIQAGALLLATFLGALATHLAHVLAK